MHYRAELKTLPVSMLKHKLSEADTDRAENSTSSSDIDANHSRVSNGRVFKLRHNCLISYAKNSTTRVGGKTVTITIQNKTDIMLKRDQNVIKHGEWLTFPPDRVRNDNL